MTNAIDQFVKTKQKNILSIYYPAGYPHVDSTIPVLKELQANGVDLVEIGIPFSDPVADGPVIQLAAKKAIENGMNLHLLFDQLKQAKSEITIPIVLMGYWNTVYQYGVEVFLKSCQETGVAAVILPDLPLEEYQRNYQQLFENYNIHNILLVSEQVKRERMKQIEQVAKGFLYVVSTPSTTGGQMLENQPCEDYFSSLKHLSVPTLMGFGINNRNSFDYACRYTNGAIIGSAFVEALGRGKEKEFLQQFK